MVSTGRSRASSWTVIVWDSSRPSVVGGPGSVMVQSEALDDGSPTSEAPEDASTTSEALDDASPTHVVRRRFSAAPPDRLTTLLVGFTVSIMGALALGGILQTVLVAQDGDLTGSLRGAGFALLGVAVVVLVWARIPTAYGLEKDAVLGTLLRIERQSPHDGHGETNQECRKSIGGSGRETPTHDMSRR